jgi:hypothetical protein
LTLADAILLLSDYDVKKLAAPLEKSTSI